MTVSNSHTEEQSKYTVDRRIPGAFEGETVTRRRFMVGTANATGAVAASAVALPLIGFAVAPIFEQHTQRWQAVGPAVDFGDDYEPRVITISDNIGETGNTTVYVRRRTAADDPPPPGFEAEQFVVISTRCMHLGCPVRYTPPAQRFICPCHGGVYDFQGKVVGGPPVRPLDRFYNRVKDGQVEVGPRFSVNRELRRFSPRLPGEAIDGLGQYLYPSRPGERKLKSLPTD